MRSFFFIATILFFSVHVQAQDKVIGEKGSKEIVGEKGSKGIIGEKSKGGNDKSNAELKQIRTELQQLLVQYIKQSTEAEATAKLLRNKFDEAAKILNGAADTNTELPQITAAYNQAEGYSSAVQKKLNETKLVIAKLDKIIGEKGRKD